MSKEKRQRGRPNRFEKEKDTAESLSSKQKKDYIVLSFSLDRESYGLFIEAKALLKKSLPEVVQHVEITKVDAFRTMVNTYIKSMKEEFIETEDDEDTDPPDWTNGAVDPDSKYADYKE